MYFDHNRMSSTKITQDQLLHYQGKTFQRLKYIQRLY